MSSEGEEKKQRIIALGCDVQDKVHVHIFGLADLLSGGIEKQFPQKFIKN